VEELVMKLSAAFVTIVAFSTLMTVSLAEPSCAVAGDGDCQAKIAGNAYDCDFKASDGSSSTACVHVFTGGLSQDFDFGIASGDDYGCACDTKGSYKSPSYDASANEFECVTNFGDELGGKIKSGGLSGEGISSGGVSMVFSCKKVKACG
jgi:hypothetical protein